MNKLKLFLAIALALMNIVLVAAINMSSMLAAEISNLIPLYGVFAALAIGFVALCYLAWWSYCNLATELDPAGACIVGFVLPVVTAFLATLSWSALAVVGAIQSSSTQFLGRFDVTSIVMIFAIFMLGGIVWGTLMKTPEYDDKTQENVAVGYTVMSYWFGFIVFSWMWLVVDRLY